MTVVGYGAQIQPLRKACTMAWDQLGVSCELIDLRTLQPWDVDTVADVCEWNTQWSLQCSCKSSLAGRTSWHVIAGDMHGQS